MSRSEYQKEYYRKMMETPVEPHKYVKQWHCRDCWATYNRILRHRKIKAAIKKELTALGEGIKEGLKL